MNLGFQVYYRNDKPNIVYLNESKDSLTFYNVLWSSDSRTVTAGAIFNPKGKYTWRIIGDTVHVVEMISKVYTAHLIQENYNFRLIRTADLSRIFGKRYFLNSNVFVDQKIEYFYPWLFLHYGEFGETGMADNVIVKVNVNDLQSKKIFEYSEKYKSCPPRVHYTILSRTQDGNIDVVFKKENTVYRINQEGDQVSISSGNPPNTNFMCFDWSKKENLAYTARYDKTDEDNLNVIHTDDLVIVIKRLRKEKTETPDTTALMIFDRDLRYKGTMTLKENVYPRMSFPHRNGVVIINSLLNKAYHYDFD